MVDDDMSTGTIAAGAVANVAAQVKGIEFPAGKREVLARAEANGADASVIATIRALPDERRYDDPVQLFDAIGDELRKLRGG